MTSDGVNHDHSGPMRALTAPGGHEVTAAMNHAPRAALATNRTSSWLRPSLGLKDSGPGRAGSQTPMAWCVMAPSRATARRPWIISSTIIMRNPLSLVIYSMSRVVVQSVYKRRDAGQDRVAEIARGASRSRQSAQKSEMSCALSPTADSIVTGGCDDYFACDDSS